MRFAVLNTVPPGFCRKMHVLAPGGRLDDLAELRRDMLPAAGLSPTHMEAIQGFADWRARGISPVLGLAMWYFETCQTPGGAFLRTDDAPEPSIGVAIRYLQLAGQLGIARQECDAVDLAAHWLELQVEEDGALYMPASGALDFGMMARAIRGLTLVNPQGRPTEPVHRLGSRLAHASTGESVWSTYPGGEPSTGATSLTLAAMAAAPHAFDQEPDPTWLLEAANPDGGWGEYEGSPSKIDNTFWAYRGIGRTSQEHTEVVGQWLNQCPISSDYERAMATRLSVALGTAVHDEQLTDLALDAMASGADRYAETALHSVALAEALTLEQANEAAAASHHQLPVRTPQFLRHEPSIYDQLAETSTTRRWTSFVDRCARLRVFETTIGWLAGMSAAVAVIGEELIEGIQALPTVALVAVASIETILVAAWLAIRHSNRRPLNGLPHFILALVLAGLIMAVIQAAPELTLSRFPVVVLTVMLGLIIDAIAVATDKADLLNRLGAD